MTCWIDKSLVCRERKGQTQFAEIAAVPFFLLLAAACAWGGELDAWRFWTAADGLQETYYSAISIGDRGEVYVRHGSVRYMSILNGYEVKQVPEPEQGIQIFGSARPRVYAGAQGHLWTVTAGSLREYQNGAWISHEPIPARPRALAAAPVGRRIVVLWADGVSEFDPVSGGWREIRPAKASRIAPFAGLIPGSGGEV